MAIRFVASGGSNTAPYETWAKAATSLATALAAATAAGDVIVLQYNAVPAGDAELAADTTYTFAGDITLLTASNDGGSAFTPTAQGTANWIGNSTTNRGVTFAGADRKCLVWGLTVRLSGGTADKILLASSTGQHTEFENCYLWQGTTVSGAGGSSIYLNNISSAFVKCTNCTFRFGATGQYLEVAAFCELLGCSIASAGSTPTVLFALPISSAIVDCIGCDFSVVTGTLIGNYGIDGAFTFDRCKFGSAVTVLASQSTNPTRGSPKAWVSDCHSGDTHMTFGYYDALGQVTQDTGIYFTSGAAALSWKIVTTANASYRTPFVTPWVDLYNTATSAITPYFEILRDGSTTAYTDAEAWSEFSVKTTSGFTTASSSVDRQVVGAHAAGTAGSNQAAGAGLGSWTGESGTAWSGKVDSGASLTPAETGSMRGRLCVAAASATVYADPQIRT